ncbi:MAG: hypothetical protein EXR67_06620 [Dehalococcoidia bacterium]|nr:hypothetical protein [Dehalococcoidia bacterium]
MDFVTRVADTPEQAKFRAEVSAWLAENTKRPEHLQKEPRELAEMTPELFEWVKQFRRRLGAKGWLAPLWPKEYGGGALSTELTQVITEEVGRAGVPRIYDNRFVAPSMMVWGTEEQKRHFLPQINRGEVLTFQAFTEPEAGSDAAGIKTTAIRDGDHYIVNGSKVFIGGPFMPDYLWTTAVTDPSAPRHRNMGCFYIPATLPGISYTTMELIVNIGKRFIFFDNVRVPAANLVGGDRNGWRVTQTSLEIEHGAGGNIGEGGGRSVLRELIRYTRETQHDGAALSKDPNVQRLLVQSYIDSHVLRLIGLRNFWMFNNKDKARSTFHGSQSSLLRKTQTMAVGNVVMEVAGPYALISDEKLAPADGEFESNQRQSITAHHPGGTTEIQRLIIARRLGLSRTAEEAAPATVA